MGVCSMTLAMLLFAEGRAVCFSAPWHALSKPAAKALQSAERLVALCPVEPGLKSGVHVLTLGAENRCPSAGAAPWGWEGASRGDAGWKGAFEGFAVHVDPLPAAPACFCLSTCPLPEALHAFTQAWKCIQMTSGRNGSIEKSLFMAGTKWMGIYLGD